MPDDPILVPVPVPAPVTSAGPVDLSQAAENMNELLQASVAYLQLQNADGAKQAATMAKAIYNQAKLYGSSTDVLLLRLPMYLVCLFDPLTSALVRQVEGRFSEALEEVDAALKVTDDAIKAVKEYAQQPDHDPHAAAGFEALLGIYVVMLRGMRAFISADRVGYQGKVSDYLSLLKKAVAEFKRAEELPPSNDPIFAALLTVCSAHASRLRTRIKFFEVTPDQSDYATPAGNRIFVIHGRNEAKWRELRDLLEKRFGQQTLILQEQADAGETLIAKFVKHARKCCYAFALLTPDDFVKKDGKSFLQARPNVLFELGWFYGHFGRDRVAIVRQKGTNIPSDLAGIVYIEFADRVDEAIPAIEKELQQIGALRTPKGTKRRSAAASSRR